MVEGELVRQGSEAAGVFTKKKEKRTIPKSSKMRFMTSDPSDPERRVWIWSEHAIFGLL